MGGGLAGLAASYELSKAKKKVIVFEKWEDVGGLARTIEKKGFRFDTGPHRWYAKNDMVNNWMLKLMGKEVIRVPRLTRIYFDGKYFFYPIKLTNALKGIGLTKSISAVFDYLYSRIKARLFHPELQTMEDGYINQFGKTLYETFFKRYSEKLWGVDCRKISIDWVGQRTRGLSVMTIIKDTFFKSKDVVSLVDEFSYPKNGIGGIANKLSKETIRYGGEVFLNSDVTQIYHSENKITEINIQDGKSNEKYVADNFISSIPLNDLILRLNPKVPAYIKLLADKLKYRDELQVALFIRKTHITPDTWIYVHPKNIPYMRVMEMDNWGDKLSPKGTTSLVFELACNEGDALWKKADKEVIDMVSESYIKEFHQIDRSDILGGYVHRVPKEYPVYHLDYKKDIDTIKEYLRKFTNLQLIGRNGTFRYNNMDHSIEMGLYAAWNLICGKNKYDIDSVNIEREYLEEKKIENVDDIPLEKNEE